MTSDDENSWPPPPNIVPPIPARRAARSWLAKTSLASGVFSLLFILTAFLFVEESPLTLVESGWLGGIAVFIPSARLAFIFLTIATMVLPLLGLTFGWKSRNSPIGRLGMWLSLILWFGSVCLYLTAFANIARALGMVK